MEEESAVSSRYKVDPSLSSPRSGTSSRSESKSDEDRELLLLRTINLRGVATHMGGRGGGRSSKSEANRVSVWEANALIVIFIKCNPLKMQVESMSLFGLY